MGKGSQPFRSQGSSQPRPWETEDPLMDAVVTKEAPGGCTISFDLMYSHCTEEKTKVEGTSLEVWSLTCCVCIPRGLVTDAVSQAPQQTF